MSGAKPRWQPYLVLALGHEEGGHPHRCGKHPLQDFLQYLLKLQIVYIL